jgi:hypothetical protein
MTWGGVKETFAENYIAFGVSGLRGIQVVRALDNDCDREPTSCKGGETWDTSCQFSLADADWATPPVRSALSPVPGPPSSVSGRSPFSIWEVEHGLYVQIACSIGRSGSD